MKKKMEKEIVQSKGSQNEVETKKRALCPEE